jgi:CYTH domain-containing protein
MPIENEIKYVFSPNGLLERELQQKFVVAILEQGYLSDGVRIRKTSSDGVSKRHFCYKKRRQDGRNIEIETSISEDDYSALWPECSSVLIKHRFSFIDNGLHWDVDFFKQADGETYFAMAEVEMPENMEKPEQILRYLQKITLYPVKRDDNRFTSFRLTDIPYAKSLLLVLKNYI